MINLQGLKSWAQKYFGWIIPFVDWVSKILTMFKWIGITTTFFISWYAIHAKKGQVESDKKVAVVSKQKDSLQGLKDSCEYQLINNKN